jgi:hypothetical protein
LSASSNLEADKPLAVIDNSLFRPICAQPEPVRVQLWAEIAARYQLVVPFVLVEEVWKRMACPGDIPRSVVEVMAQTLYEMHPRWIDEPIAIAFRELVLKQPLKTFPAPPQEIMDALWMLDSTDPKLAAHLAELRLAKEKRTKEIISEQDSILPEGTFCFVKNQRAFFRAYIRNKFWDILADKSRAKMLLEKMVGRDFRKRHPQDSAKIDRAFAEYDRTTFAQYPVTLACIMAQMFYFYAPLVRIGEAGQPGARKIVGRSFKAQINNSEDEKYVISALMCNRLLTCDQGMANIVSTFKASGLWERGEVVYSKPADIRSMIPNKLV